MLRTSRASARHLPRPASEQEWNQWPKDLAFYTVSARWSALFHTKDTFSKRAFSKTSCLQYKVKKLTSFETQAIFRVTSIGLKWKTVAALVQPFRPSARHTQTQCSFHCSNGWEFTTELFRGILNMLFFKLIGHLDHGAVELFRSILKLLFFKLIG